MAILRIPEEQRTLEAVQDISDYLKKYDIDYERWESIDDVATDASAEQILEAFAAEVEALKSRGGYVTADVIDVGPATPGLEEMLRKFSCEHWHDEDEVRFIVAGHGLFHIHPKNGPVVAIEVGRGDLLRVPRGTLHWFDLCTDRRIRAIRLFQDVTGWTPHYTDSGVDKKFQPVCFGPTHLPYTTPAKL